MSKNRKKPKTDGWILIGPDIYAHMKLNNKPAWVRCKGCDKCMNGTFYDKQ